jgi:parvulin-like peptidyl-prolyl isomerase
MISMEEADKAGIKVTGSDISATFDSVFEGIGGEDQTSEYVKSFYGMTLNQLRAEAVPKIALQKIRESEFVRVKARLILVKDDKRAKEALDKIRGGAKFEDVARDYSEDQGSKDQGGVLADGEYIYRDSGIITELEGPLFSMKAGETSDVIKTGLGNAILKIEEHSGTIDQKSDDWFADLMKKDYPVRVWI